MTATLIAAPRTPAPASTRRRPRALLFAAFAATLALAGCAPAVGQHPFAAMKHRDAPAILTVQNAGPFATRILFARPAGVEVPIATIGAGETRTLLLSAFVTDLGPVEFVARGRAASQEVRTEQVLISPGDRVEWLLEPLGVGSRSPAPLRLERSRR